MFEIEKFFTVNFDTAFLLSFIYIRAGVCFFCFFCVILPETL